MERQGFIVNAGRWLRRGGHRVRRRDLLVLAGTAVLLPRTGTAQQRKIPVIGYLSGGSASFYATILPSFREGLGESGSVEGKNVAIEYRWAERSEEHTSELQSHSDLV